MFLTIKQNQIPSLLDDQHQAWPLIEIEFGEPFFVCSWRRPSAIGMIRGTALVLLEKDLRDWAEGAAGEPQALLMLVPQKEAWSATHIQKIWSLQGEEPGSGFLGFEDEEGAKFSLWPDAKIPKILPDPIWACEAVSGAFSDSHQMRRIGQQWPRS